MNRDLPDPTGKWRDDELLRELHVRRGWSAPDIARYFEAPKHTVEDELDERGLDAGGENPPTRGFAAKVWRQSIAEKRKEAAHGD